MYIVASANLLAASYGLVPQPMNGPKGTVPPPGAVSNDDGWNTFVAPESDWRTLQYAEALAGDEGLDEPMFVKSKVEIDSGEKKKDDGETKGDDGSASGGGEGGGSADAADAGAKFEALLQELASIDLAGVKGAPADFEKDLDLNFHIDFIFAAANLRACNYGIRSADRHKCKMIAGKIIPAIATSTACATALVGIEILKLLQGDKELGAFKSSTCNFAINTFQMSEPLGVIKKEPKYDVELDCEVTPRPEGFTKWDKHLIEGDSLTIKAIAERIEEITGLTLYLLLHSASLAYDTDADPIGKWADGSKQYPPKFKDAPTFLYHKDDSTAPVAPKNLTHKVAAFRKKAETAHARNLKAYEGHAAKVAQVAVDFCNEQYGNCVGTNSTVELDAVVQDAEGNMYTIPKIVYKYK